MKEVKLKWEKDGKTVEVYGFICECGGIPLNIGSAGCSHNQEFTYFYQCPNCKSVYLSDAHLNNEDMVKFGYTLKNESYD